MEFEDIRPWDGIIGSGKDARLVIKRNFEKVKAAFTGIFDSLEMKADKESVNSKVSEIESAILKKADTTAVGESLLLKADLVNGKVPATQLPISNSLEDSDSGFILDARQGRVLQGKINDVAKIFNVSIFEQDPDWMNIFSRIGAFVFVDDEHGLHRPIGLPTPEKDEPISYQGFTYNLNSTSGYAHVRADNEGKIYELTLSAGTIKAQWIITNEFMSGNPQSPGAKADLVDGKVPAVQLPISNSIEETKPGFVLDARQGKIISDMIKSILEPVVIQQDPDWLSILEKHGSIILQDDNHGTNRPEGIPEPPDQVTVRYDIHILVPGANGYSMAKDPAGNVFILTHHGDSIYSQKMATAVQLDAVEDILDVLNGDLESDVNLILAQIDGI